MDKDKAKTELYTALADLVGAVTKILTTAYYVEGVGQRTLGAAVVTALYRVGAPGCRSLSGDGRRTLER